MQQLLLTVHTFPHQVIIRPSLRTNNTNITLIFNILNFNVIFVFYRNNKCITLWSRSQSYVTCMGLKAEYAALAAMPSYVLAVKRKRKTFTDRIYLACRSKLTIQYSEEFDLCVCLPYSCLNILIAHKS